MTISISAPAFVSAESLPVHSDMEMAVCNIEIVGFDEPYVQSVIGADLLQALQLATDIDPILKGYSELYDFFYEDGEPYFASEQTR